MQYAKLKLIPIALVLGLSSISANAMVVELVNHSDSAIKVQLDDYYDAFKGEITVAPHQDIQRLAFGEANWPYLRAIMSSSYKGRASVVGQFSDPTVRSSLMPNGITSLKLEFSGADGHVIWKKLVNGKVA